MVQVLDKIPSKLERLLGGLGSATQGIAEGGQSIKGAMDTRKTRNALADRFGEEFKNIRDPNIQKLMLQGALEKESLQEKQKAEELSLPDYETVKEQFGKGFADLYKTAPVGGKTELLKAGLGALSRGEKISDLLGGEEDQVDLGTMRNKKTDQEIKIPQIQNGQISKDFRPPDFTKKPQGFTSKEWAHERAGWGIQNTKDFEEARTKVKSIDRDILGTKKLQKLNNTKKVGEGFERSLINPSTGEFYGLSQLSGLVSPEAQEWVKEISRFGNRAKDAFGSRVTNFDLFQYMKQFPGLLNTHEGRNRILRMMSINYDLDRLYEDTRKQLYQKVGSTEIPPQQVDKLVQEMISGDKERLENEFLGIERKNDMGFMENEEGRSQRPSLEEIFG